MAATWVTGPSGEWLVRIPEGEVENGLWGSGAGVYEVERKDGTVREVLVERTSAPFRYDGDWYRYGHPAGSTMDRAARPEVLTHAPAGGCAPRLTRQRSHVIAPESVLDRALAHRGRLELDDLVVWIEHDDPDEPDQPRRWRRWTHKGIRFAKAPVQGTKAF